MSEASGGRISELVTRLILNSTGSAFAKLQIHHAELCNNEEKSVQKLIEYLGGQWGKTGLEKRYADAEKALFQCQQQSDESHDSYLARADVLWSKLKSQKLKIDDLQAYITLRGAQLSSEDKKRIILDSDSSLEGTLTISRVQDAVRLLGTSFFNEMTGLGKKPAKSKVYDSATLAVEDSGDHGDAEDQVHLSSHEDWTEDDILEAMLAEGDEDAIYITDFEAAASEILQADDDISSAYSTYVEARRKLNEKFRARGFWPLSKGRGRFGGGKGKSKGKGGWGQRKSLQQRILESHCRLCGKKGHWRNECPNKSQSNVNASSSAAVTLSMASPGDVHDTSMPEEFLLLPEVPSSVAKDILSKESPIVQPVFYGIRMMQNLQLVSSFVIKTSVPHRVTFRPPRTMSGWSNRLAKVQSNLVKPAPEEPIGHLTLAMLKEEPVTFGKAHLGKTHEEVWTSSPEWIKWFLGHYASSGKLEHRKMIRFIQLKIEESEVEPSAKSLAKSLGAKPKAQSAPSPEILLPEEPGLESFELMSDAPWVAASGTREDIQALQARMLSLEEAMRGMITMMQSAMPMHPASTTTGSATAEWDDPWNN
eukprot:s1763_g3.t1